MKLDIKLYKGDCFEQFKNIANNSVDLVLVDPPYGTTAIKWDAILDFEIMWKEINRVLKPDSNAIIFGSQPFTSHVILSNLKHFKYELIWNKNKCGSPGLAKHRPMKVHENIMIFSNGKSYYNPIMEEGEAYKRFNANGYGSGKNTHGYGFGKQKTLGFENTGTRYPKSILHASRNFSAQQGLHPTQKPTNLLSWLIMNYCIEKGTVLDFTMGSGSTGVAAKMTGRNFIGIELEEEFYEIAIDRISNVEHSSIDRLDHQLTTQIHKDMITKNINKHENIDM